MDDKVIWLIVDVSTTDVGPWRYGQWERGKDEAGVKEKEGRGSVLKLREKGVGEKHVLIANKEEGAVSLKRMKWVKPQTSKLL